MKPFYPPASLTFPTFHCVSMIAFAGYTDTIVSTTYDLFNRKFFSLPKVLLLPMVMARQPKMMAQIFPIIFLTDWLKQRAVTYMTSRIEHLRKEIQELNAVRSKVEAFDIKNAELLQRAGKYSIYSETMVSGPLLTLILLWFALINDRAWGDRVYEATMGGADSPSSNENSCEGTHVSDQRIFCLYSTQLGVYSIGGLCVSALDCGRKTRGRRCVCLFTGD